MEYLKGHTSPETAYLVNDYHYGFRLRCKIRYWLEYKKGKGFRFVSQTTNPKKSFGALNLATGERSEPWNKPKASTYSHGLAVMALNTDNGHVTWIDSNYSYDTAESLQDKLNRWRDCLPVESIEEAERYIRIKIDYEKRKEAGVPYQLAAIQAVAHEEKIDDTVVKVAAAIVTPDPACIDEFLADNRARIAPEKDPTCVLCEFNEDPGHEH